MTNFIGKSFGRYRILEQLGEGGMAIVYKAYDTRLERDVAIKFIRRGAFPPDQLDRILKRFEREAKALAKLSHPNIVRVLDFGDYEGSPYLVMEHLPGGTLKHRLGKPMPWQEAVRIILPISEALEYAHEHNVIHRDIKPSNILLTEKGQPMLTDFGIAKILEVKETTSLTGSGIGVGTPEYMAPEQWTGQTTAHSDIYSLGVVLYEMVTGRKPYEADTPAAILLKQATAPLPRPKAYVPNLPDAVEKVILKALAKKASDRYRDMPALIGALEKLMGGKDSSKGVVAPKLSKASESRSLHERTENRAKAVQADETADEFGTQTDPFESTPARVPLRPARSPTFMRGGTWVVVVLFVTFGEFFVWNALADSKPQATPSAEKTDRPNPTDTPHRTSSPYPTFTPYPTNTPYPTDKPRPSPTIKVPEPDLGEWMIIVGAGLSSYESAWDWLQPYRQFGDVQVFYRETFIRAAVVGFSSQAEAGNVLPSVQVINEQAYLRSVREWCPTRTSYPDHIECR